jgi:hydroxymethylbilane synthase
MADTTGLEHRELALGTRASKLALAQAELVRAALLALRPGLQIRLQHITTKGDAMQDRPLSEIGGNGVFVTRIEEALRAGEVDFAVHSAKDLSSSLPEDMVLAAFLERADPRDVLVSRDGAGLMSLPHAARIGTGSPRRACQVLALRPDLCVLDIRGNVDTRLRKLRDGEYDAIVLAAAGLQRLDALDHVTEWLEPEVMVPAVGQGALAVEVRAADRPILELTRLLDDPNTSAAVRAERAFLATVGGGCSLPVGAFARVEGQTLRILGMIGTAGGPIVKGEHTGSLDEPEKAGAELAGMLLANGGRELVQAGDLKAVDEELPSAFRLPPSAPPPLEGRRIVVTRAGTQAAGLVERLRALGAVPVECPAIAIAPLEDFAPLDAAIRRLESYDWVIFTSVNGVEAFSDRMQALKMGPSLLSARKLGAIGPATRDRLEALDCSPDFVPDAYVAEAIVEQIPDIKGCRVLLPRADIARKALADGLRERGAQVDEVAAYRTVHGEASVSLAALLSSGSVDAITFTSSSTVRYTIDSLVQAGIESRHVVDFMNSAAVVCIGPITAATAAEHGLNVTAVAGEYTTGGLVDALIGLFSARSERGS